MNFDLGEVLTRAWQISWQNKSLWWFGIMGSLIVLIFLLLLFVPFSIPFLFPDRVSDLFPISLIGFFVIFPLFLVFTYAIGAITQASVTLGVLRVERGEEKLPLVELIRNSLPFFWRIVGVMFLYAAAVMVVNLAVQAFIFLITVVTFGFGAFCATPLTFLLYPAILVTLAWQEQAINGILIDTLGVVDAIKQGWQIIRNNLLAVGLILVVVYFGIGMATSIIIMPMMIPLFILPITFIEGEPNWILVSISLLCGAVSFPLFAIVSGWSITFTKSAMVSTYLRLTRPSNTPIVQEAAA